MSFSRRRSRRLNRGRTSLGVSDGGDGPPPDTTAPQVVGVTTSTDGLSILVEYNETLAVIPAAGDISIGGTAATAPSATSGVGTDTLTITLPYAIVKGETVTVTTTVACEDAAGNEADLLSAEAVTNLSTEELTLEILTRLSDLSGNMPSRPGSATVHCWGGAGGGTAATGGGGSGAYARLTWTYAANEAFALAVGAGGASGGGTGGDTTLNTTQCVAKGAVGTTGGLSASCVGDVVRAGENGILSSGNANGAASPGSTSAASGSTPGEPDGGLGANANSNNAAKIPAGGGRSNVLNGYTGAQGLIRLLYQEAATPGYPPIIGASITRTGNGTSHVVVLPSGNVGDRLLYIVAADGAPTISITGATLISGTHVNGAASSLACFERVATGTDSDTVSLTDSEPIGCIVLRFRDAAAIVGTAAEQASSVTPDTPSLATGVSAERTWLAICGRDATVTNGSISGPPSGYVRGLYVPEFSASGVQLYVTWRNAVASTEEPGTWTTQTADTTITATLGVAHT